MLVIWGRLSPGEVWALGGGASYRVTMLMMNTSGQMVKMLAMPRAKHRIMERIPSL